jgi:type III secretion protein Q
MNSPVFSSSSSASGPRAPQASSVSALKLPRWRSEEALVHNLLRSGLQMDLSALETGTWLELHPGAATLPAATGQAASPPNQGEPWLALEGDAGALCIDAGRQWIQALTHIPIDLTTNSAEQTWLRSTAAALLPFPLSPLFNTLRRWDGARPPADTYCAQLALRTKDHVITTHGYASAAVWRRMFSVHARVNSHRGVTSQWRSWLCRQPVMVGRHVLSAARVKQLQVGDIVLPQEPLFNAHGRGRLHWGTWQLDVQSTVGSELEVVGMYQDSDNQDAIDDAPAAVEFNGTQDRTATTRDTDLSSIPMTLNFQLGVLTMPLGQMQTLDIGSILTLQAPAAPPQVDILVGGRAFGKGDLVDVDGHLGIQITQWAGA